MTSFSLSQYFNSLSEACPPPAAKHPEAACSCGQQPSNPAQCLHNRLGHAFRAVLAPAKPQAED